MVGVSVIIPCLNGATYLRQCLDSVLDQQFAGEMEVIVADDGSTDESLEIVKSYGSPVILVACPENARHGCGVARNRAIRVSRFPLLAFIDADDLWLPGHLTELASALESSPNVALACDNGYFVDQDGNRLGAIHKNTFRPALTPEAVLLNCFTDPSAVMIRRAAIERVGFFSEDAQLLYVEDHDLWLRVLEQFSGVYVPHYGYCYRIHSTQVSCNPVMWQNAANILTECAKRHPYTRKALRKRRAVLAYRNSESAFRQRHIARAVALLCKAAFLDPIRAANEIAARLKKTLCISKSRLTCLA